MIKTIFGAFLLTMASFTVAQAQKFGFCDSNQLLSEIPEVKQADTELQSYQGQLTKRGQEMVKALQDKVDDLKRRQDQGNISPKDAEALKAKLNEEQETISKYQQEVYQKLAEKRKELYNPILDKVNDAMKKVAEENGFMLVFDLNSNFVLYGHESLDVTKLVKTKLGIPN